MTPEQTEYDRGYYHAKQGGSMDMKSATRQFYQGYQGGIRDKRKADC